MKLRVVASLKVVDKVAQEYDMPKLDENGKEIGRNTGVTHTISVKPEGGVIQNLKLPSTLPENVYNTVEVGKMNDVVFEFETDPTAYIDKTGKAKVNFSHTPKIVDILPFEKK